MPMKVLVLDADSAAGLECVQSLGRKGCIVDTASLRPEYPRARSRFIRTEYDLTGLEDGGVRRLVDLFNAENYDLVVPPTEVALLALLGPQIPGEMYLRAVLPAQESVRTALDKQQVWTLAQTLGVRVPWSDLVSADSAPPGKFPVVLKPVFSKTRDSGAVEEFRVAIARDLDQWRAAMDLTYRRVAVQQQQYITGKGVGVEMLFEHGTARWSFLHERVHELPLTGGGSSYRVSIGQRGDLVESATALLEALKWHGVAMVEFKVAPNGEAWLMEINPRLWGSLALAIDCGVDFPLGLLCLATGQPLSPQPKYRTGYFTRSLTRDVAWLKANLRADHSDPLLLTRPIVPSLLETLRPLMGKESWDFFCWSDPGIVLAEVRALVRGQLRGAMGALKRRGLRFYLRKIRQPRVLGMLRGRKAKKVLVLCYGNICRSPLAAAMAARRFPNTQITSAGFYPKTGRPSPDFVLAESDRLGFDLKGHRSQCVDAGMIDEADLILIMDIRNYGLLKKSFPGALNKTLFLGMLLPEPQLEIDDPYDDPATMPETAAILQTAIDRMNWTIG
jgi:protein-tyrosine-phosphatase/predicted ATP-grasp superfamily ATP-dependent carboligase